MSTSLPTLVFHDSMIMPRLLDLSSVDWFYPIALRPMNENDTRLVRHRVYRSRRVGISHWKETFNVIDMTIYLHNASDAVSNCVRIYGWKKTLMPFNVNALASDLQYIRSGSEDFYDYTPITFSPNTAVAVYSLKVDDFWDDFQVVVSQPCSAVSIYLNQFDPSYPSNYLRMNGSLLDIAEGQLLDDFDGDNFDWETP